MKKLVFIREKESNKLLAKVVEDRGLDADGSTVTITYELLEECRKQGIFKKYCFGRGNDNVFYDAGDMTFLRIKDDKVVVLDESLVEGEWIGHTFERLKRSVSLKRSKDTNGESRGICRISMQNVKHLDKTKKNEKIDKHYSVQLARVFWDIKLGKIDSLVDEKLYDIVDNEAHHEGFTWDNRLHKTIALTRQEHNEYHTINGAGSHQVYCKVNTVEEMVALIEYLRNN